MDFVCVSMFAIAEFRISFAGDRALRSRASLGARGRAEAEKRIP